MSSREIVLNLWHVRDREGNIYSLRVKPYVFDGTEAEKLEFLRERARHDHLVAPPFEVPKPFHQGLLHPATKQTLPVSHVSMLAMLESPIAIYEEAIKQVEAGFPAQSHLWIPEDPLVCNTPLMKDAHGRLEPGFTGQTRY